MRAMRAERFGSYSIPTTSAGTPRLRRLKSTLRYFCLWPPPIWRDVSRPKLLRPPVFFFGATRRFAGLAFVISSKPGSDLNRSVGVSGRKFFRAITGPCSHQIDLLALCQRHDCLFPMRTASQRSTHPFLFPDVITGVHVDHLFLEQTFDRGLDLNFVRPRTDAENIFVLLLTQQCRFFLQRSGLNDVVRFVHLVLSARRSSASCVTRIFSKASNCSVFTSEAVASVTGFTLRPDFKVF